MRQQAKEARSARLTHLPVVHNDVEQHALHHSGRLQDPCELEHPEQLDDANEDGGSAHRARRFEPGVEGVPWVGGD